MTPNDAARLIPRIDGIALYAHAYAWHLNFRLGQAVPTDLLRFADEQGLRGVKIHVEDGEERSLLHNPSSREGFGRLARDLGLEVHIETSATDEATLRAGWPLIPGPHRCAAIRAMMARCRRLLRKPSAICAGLTALIQMVG